MPIEIRELHIRVSVDAGNAKPAAGSQASDAKPGSSADKDAIVAECVEQVMEIIQAKKER